MADTVDIAVEFHTPLGPIRGQVTVERAPVGLANLVPLAQQWTEIVAHRANGREAAAGRRVSCRAGCGACCRQMVPVSPPEALYLAVLVDALPDPERRRVRGRFEAIVESIERRGLTAALLRPRFAAGDLALPVARDYFALQMPCPFLEDESCSIHPFRPVACRGYNVTSPAELCANPYVHEIRKVPMPLPLSVPLARLTASLTGSEPCLIPLSLAPRWVAEHEDLSRRRWPGMELFAGFLREIGARPQSDPAAP